VRAIYKALQINVNQKDLMEQDAEDDNSLLRASGEQALSASNGGLISP